eukprot:m.22237 g.22237  ORF g.22237 m.22237 type:complete len:536 (+) comp7378_c1_seq1:289-1896(+)
MGKSKKKWKASIVQDGSNKKENPFELRFNKRKHTVLGQRTKGDVGKRGKSRDLALQQREKTLRVEMQQKHRTNQFNDKRFGEYNENLSAEDKMMMRFQLERKRNHERGGSAFQLNDGENEYGLTHGGQALGDFDDYEPSEDEEDIALQELAGAKTTEKLNFGGFEPVGDNPEHKRTRKEIMAEVVAKAKQYKQERQSKKRAAEALTEELDAELPSIMGTLVAASDAKEKEMEKEKKKPDDYDIAMRQLTFEAKGRALDRIKTDEEVATEELRRLQKLEEERIARMKGETPGKKKKVNLEQSVEYVGNDEAPKGRSQLVLQPTDDGKAVLEMQGEDEDEEGDDDDDDDEYENANYADLKPWDVSEDPFSGDSDLFVKPTEIPTFTSLADMEASDYIEVHRSEGGKRGLTITPPTEALQLHEAVNALCETQGEDICIVEVDKEYCHYANFVLVATGRSRRHMRSMVQNVKQKLQEKNQPLPERYGRIHGWHDNFWMLIHCEHFVVHVFAPEARPYYNLEGLWAPRGSPLYEKESDLN